MVRVFVLKGVKAFSEVVTKEHVVKFAGGGNHICAFTLATRVRAAVKPSQPTAAADQRVPVS